MTDYQFSLQDIQREFTGVNFQQGVTCFENQQVLNIRRQDDGRLLFAQIKDQHQHYKAVIALKKNQQGDIHFTGHCTCSAGFDCKHMVAALLERLNQTESITPNKITTTTSLQLGHPIEHWLSQLNQLNQEQDAPKTNHEQLHYIITFQRSSDQTQVAYLNAQQVRLSKLGEIHHHEPFDIRHIITKVPLRFVQPSDIKLAKWLCATDPTISLNHHPHFKLDDSDGTELLLCALATRRCHWQSLDNPVLKPGPVETATATWNIDANGNQSLHYQMAQRHIQVLPVKPFWYIDTTEHLIGELQVNEPYELAKCLYYAPVVTPDEITSVITSIKKIFSNQKLSKQSIPQPTVLKITTAKKINPIPYLSIKQATLAINPNTMAADHWLDLPEEPYHELSVVALHFYYGPHRIAADAANTTFVRYQDNALLEIQREFNQENSAIQSLIHHDFVALNEVDQYRLPAKTTYHYALLNDESRIKIIDFCRTVVPQLKSAGWQIEFDPDFPYHYIADTDHWYVEVKTEKDKNWFNLELGIEHDNERINVLPLIINLLREHQGALNLSSLDELPDDHSIALRLDDGRLLSIPLTRLRGILKTLAELHQTQSPQKPSNQLSLSNYQAVVLAELNHNLQANQLTWYGDKKLPQLGEKIRSGQVIKPISIPRTFKAKLRPYQRQGVNWLQFLREYELAGILADDMGLGKTIQVLAHIAVEKKQARLTRPCLVVAPTSLMFNWSQEAKRFLPDLKVLILQGNDRHKAFAKVNEYELILTTYPLLHRDRELLLNLEFHLLILDEAHYIKNPKSKSTQVVNELNAKHRLCLTGTPVENHLGELWSLFQFLLPGFLGSIQQFGQLFRTPIEKQQDDTRQTILNQRIAPFLLRRTKQAVISELPPKTEIVQNIELTGDQRDLYESIRLSMHSKIKQQIHSQGFSRTQIIILDALLKLRQVCCDPRLLKLSTAQQIEHSAKLETLMEMLPELIAEGRKILLFSQFTTMLALIERRLTQAAISYVKLTGQTKDRITPIERFQNGEVPVFLISLKAGGTGLNLTAADTVIHYDPWWNPAVENQATDRAHRIGQDKSVFVYRLVTIGTVEEKMLTLQSHKQALADNLFDQTNQKNTKLTWDDLNILFEPLS